MNIIKEQQRFLRVTPNIVEKTFDLLIYQHLLLISSIYTRVGDTTTNIFLDILRKSKYRLKIRYS